MHVEDAATASEEPVASLDPRAPDPAAALLELCNRRGMRARLVSLARAEEARRELAERRERRELDPELFEECLAELSFAPPEDLPSARSILVAAVPRPETAAVFEAGGASRRLPIPPTYTGYRPVSARWLQWLRATLAPAGHRAAATNLPLKLLATRSGLASYGRNNITYVEGLGSYFELVAAYTDVPCERDGWRPAALLDRCATCRACVNLCPTGAIPLDRVLLRAERCLVFHNERPGEIPFPGWIDPSAHHAVIGCMECQRICPENRSVVGWSEPPEAFSAEETALLLAGTREAELPQGTIAKLARLDALRFLPLLGRNLGAALGAPLRGGPTGPAGESGERPPPPGAVRSRPPRRPA